MLYDFDDMKTLSRVIKLLYAVLILVCFFIGGVVYWLEDFFVRV